MISYLRGMRLNTKTTKLPKKEIKKIINTTLEWCSANLGVNNRRKYRFQISVKKQLKGEKRYGEFNCVSNKMTIFYNNCDNVKDLVTTVIHEYTHYLQPVRTYYGALAKYFDYNCHPMEVEARMNESIYFKKSWKYVKSIL
jgi:uncharacterized protein YjaZ